MPLQSSQRETPRAQLERPSSRRLARTAHRYLPVTHLTVAGPVGYRVPGGRAGNLNTSTVTRTVLVLLVVLLLASTSSTTGRWGSRPGPGRLTATGPASGRLSSVTVQYPGNFSGNTADSH
eukprot:435817-Rhodomonas_salina.3